MGFNKCKYQRKMVMQRTWEPESIGSVERNVQCVLNVFQLEISSKSVWAKYKFNMKSVCKNILMLKQLESSILSQ